jgi:hypothetical protein
MHIATSCTLVIESRARCTGSAVAYTKHIAAGGRVTHFGPVSSTAGDDAGTHVQISGLFSKMPVRRLVENDSTDVIYARLVSAMQQVALGHPYLRITLISSDSRTLLAVTPQPDWSSVVRHICGEAVMAQVEAVECAHNGSVCRGYLSPPSSSCSHISREFQHITMGPGLRELARAKADVQELHAIIGDAYQRCFQLLQRRKSTSKDLSSGMHHAAFPIYMLQLDISSGGASASAPRTAGVGRGASSLGAMAAAAKSCVSALLLTVLPRFGHAVPDSVLRTLRTHALGAAASTSGATKARTFLGTPYTSGTAMAAYSLQHQPCSERPPTSAALATTALPRSPRHEEQHQHHHHRQRLQPLLPTSASLITDAATAAHTLSAGMVRASASSLSGTPGFGRAATLEQAIPPAAAALLQGDSACVDHLAGLQRFTLGSASVSFGDAPTEASLVGTETAADCAYHHTGTDGPRMHELMQRWRSDVTAADAVLPELRGSSGDGVAAGATEGGAHTGSGQGATAPLATAGGASLVSTVSVTVARPPTPVFSFMTDDYGHHSPSNVTAAASHQHQLHHQPHQAEHPRSGAAAVQTLGCHSAAQLATTALPLPSSETGSGVAELRTRMCDWSPAYSVAVNTGGAAVTHDGGGALAPSSCRAINSLDSASVTSRGAPALHQLSNSNSGTGRQGAYTDSASASGKLAASKQAASAQQAAEVSSVGLINPLEHAVDMAIMPSFLQLEAEPVLGVNMAAGGASPRTASPSSAAACKMRGVPESFAETSAKDHHPGSGADDKWEIPEADASAIAITNVDLRTCTVLGQLDR